MKRNILSYTAPEVNVFEVIAERGYNVSEPIIGGTGVTLPVTLHNLKNELIAISRIHYKCGSVMS